VPAPVSSRLLSRPHRATSTPHRIRDVEQRRPRRDSKDSALRPSWLSHPAALPNIPRCESPEHSASASDHAAAGQVRCSAAVSPATDDAMPGDVVKSRRKSPSLTTKLRRTSARGVHSSAQAPSDLGDEYDAATAAASRHRFVIARCSLTRHPAAFAGSWVFVEC
jgi:hypothetical protein